MEIKIHPKYLDHQEGTKFYEAIAFHNVRLGCYVLVRRWGKKTARRKKGETKIERFGSQMACEASLNAILRDKGNRGYYETASTFDLHGEPAAIDAEVIRLRLAEHYADPDVIDGVMDGLGLSNLAGGVAFEEDAEDDVIAEEPKPEIVRDANWGSW